MGWQVLEQLIRRDIRVKFGQSRLSFLWPLASQFAVVFVCAVLSSQRVLNTGEYELPQLVHVLYGVSLWQLFSGVLLSSATSLTRASSLITKASFPKIVVVLASCGVPLVEFCIRLVPLFFAFFYERYSPSWEIVFLPFIIILVVILALAIGVFLSLFNLLFRDLEKIISVFLSFGLFLSPAIYPLPKNNFLLAINQLNPFTPIIVTSHDLMLGRGLSYPFYFSLVILGSILIFVFALRLFQFSIHRIVERA